MKYSIDQIKEAREGTHIGEGLLELLIENLQTIKPDVAVPIQNKTNEDLFLRWLEVRIANLKKYYKKNGTTPDQKMICGAKLKGYKEVKLFYTQSQ